MTSCLFRGIAAVVTSMLPVVASAQALGFARLDGALDPPGCTTSEASGTAGATWSWNLPATHPDNVATRVVNGRLAVPGAPLAPAGMAYAWRRRA